MYLSGCGKRILLEDGDDVVISGYCLRPGFCTDRLGCVPRNNFAINHLTRMGLVHKQDACGAVCTMAAELPVPQPASASTARAYRLILLLLFLNPLGNLLLAWGLKHTALLAGNPLDYVLAMLNPFAALGILMLILAFLTRMALFSVADLSFVLPITAAGYVIAAFYGKFFLSEHISPQRWLGTALIFVGIAFVGTTSATTTDDFAEAVTADESI